MTRTPSIPQLRMAHRSNGGTGVTNFQPDLMPVMREALEESGREDLILCSVGFVTEAIPTIQRDMCSLHCTARFANISTFWAIFDRIRHSELQAA